jgi:hypothetical protein
MSTVTRRTFAKIAASASLGTTLEAGDHAVPTSTYRRADASWFAACPFGVSTHWTALSQAVHPADWRPFPETVAKFDVERFADNIASSGASYLIFTSCHALQWLPGPCDAIERVLPGRTNRRDMLGDLARALHQRDVHFIAYYNHSCNHGDDPAWELAVGYHQPDKTSLVANLLKIVRELGERHGELMKAWWFDSCYSLDTHGANWGKGTIPDTFRFPWNDLVSAAKSANPNRLVTLNAGMMRYYLYTDHQDYEWGEANDLIAVPAAQFTRQSRLGSQSLQRAIVVFALQTGRIAFLRPDGASLPRPGHLQHRCGPQRRVSAGNASTASAAQGSGGLSQVRAIQAPGNDSRQTGHSAI